MNKWQITVIDKSDLHLCQPGLIFLPFKMYGYHNKKDLTKPIRKPVSTHARFVNAEIKLIDHVNKKVETSQGSFEYDWLVSSMGCTVAPAEVEGLEEAFGKNAYTFYTLDGALQMQKAIENMKEGRLVLNIAEMPIKCPVAPLEFVFLADDYFTRKGVRKNIEIIYVTPLEGAFTKPQASRILSGMFEKKNIKIVPNFPISTVDHIKKQITSYTGENVEYDMFVSIPPNLGPEVIDDSSLGTGSGYMVVQPGNLKSEKADYIYGIGDNTNILTSKAGSVTHFEAEIVAKNLLREIDGKEPHIDFDGHANCFIESGFHKAMLIDFNYDVEPLPGTFPIPGLGPFSLLKETTLNHWGKLGFKWIYWNLLLSGYLKGGPLVPIRMSMKGKDSSLLAK
jgi:sulfide:quinone oxidoreductase